MKKRKQEETVGERLRRLRLAAGLSQRELSERGVSYAYISRIEAGARRPSVKALRKLAPKLGVTAHYLEFGENDPRDPDYLEAELAKAQARVEELEAIIDQAKAIAVTIAAHRDERQLAAV